MPDSVVNPVSNLNQPQLGQGVRNIPLPPDPFDKAEALPAAPPPPTQIATTPTPEPTPPAPPPPAPVPETKPKEREVVQVTGLPPKIETNLPPPPPPLKSYSYKAKSGRPPLLVLVLVPFIFLGLIAGGIYFVKKINNPTPTQESTPLNLPKDQPPETANNSFTKSVEPPKPAVPEDKGFGPLSEPDLTSYLLSGLKLKGAVVANEAPLANEGKKQFVYLKVSDPNVASVSAFFSKDYQTASGSANLTEAEFLKKVDPLEKSYYEILDESVALSNLVSTDNFYGLASPKIDWKKYSLKSWEISNFALVYFYTSNPVEKYVQPIYVFEGKAKLKGLVDGKVVEVNLKLFTPSLVE